MVAPPPVATRDVSLVVLADNETADQNVASALGWAAGLPGIELTVTPLVGDDLARLATTGPDGRVELLAMPLGSYRVEGRRLLTAAEKSTLSAAGLEAEAFVGTTRATVAVGGSAELVARLPASFRHGLLISESANSSALLPGLGHYYYSTFTELYNNGDTTVFLDGTQFASISSYAGAGTGWATSCAEFASYAEDPNGLWTSYLTAFPGSGGQYPLEPGGTAVIAMDAIDHRGLYPEMLDLSAADFEYLGGPDNPAVPNMLDHSVRANPIHTHGPFIGYGSASALSLSLPVDPASLPFVRRPPSDFPYVQVPGTHVVDVFTAINLTSVDGSKAISFPGYQACPRFVSTTFDRGYGILLQESEQEYTVSQSRKVLYVRDDGRPVLQHTRNSAADFHRTPRTPGTVVP